MTEHVWDDATHICTRCAVQKGAHGIECLATPNVVGMHHLRIRQLWEREGRLHGLDYPPAQLTDHERKMAFENPFKANLRQSHLRRRLDAVPGAVTVEHFPKPPPESA